MRSPAYLAIAVALALLLLPALVAAQPAACDVPLPCETPPLPDPCGPTAVDRALRTRGRMVTISGRLDSGLGFVFFDRRHVLTTFGAVFWGESLVVTLAGQPAARAEVVATDAEHDLAVLRLRADAPTEPLTAGPPAQVGDTVFAVVLADEERASVFDGKVNSAATTRLETRALAGFHHPYGAPVLDCSGRVVAVAHGGFGPGATPIALARTLWKQVGVQPLYHGPAVRPRFEIGLVGNASQLGGGGGAYLGLGLSGRPGWGASLLRVGLLGVGEQGRVGPRVFVQSLAGLRAELSDSLALVAQIGATFGYDQLCTGGCRDGAPDLFNRVRLMPTGEVGLSFWPGTLRYQYQHDVGRSEASVHQLLLGIDM